LQLDPDQALDPRWVATDVDPGDDHPALVGVAQPLEDLHGGGLAGAVGSEDAEDLVLADVEGDAVDGHDLAVALAEILDLDRHPLGRGRAEIGLGEGGGHGQIMPKRLR